MWHVTLTVAGRPSELEEVRAGLERLAQDHPFLLASRYASDRAEVSYWEQARDVYDASAMALRLWGEHQASARLPKWSVVGLEVVDRETYRSRGAQVHLVTPGVHPF